MPALRKLRIRRTLRPVLGLALVLLTAGMAYADIFVTHDGQTIRGQVLSKTDTDYTIKTPYGRLVIPAKDLRGTKQDTYILHLKDGETLSGKILGQTEAQLDVELEDGSRQQVQRETITDIAIRPLATLDKQRLAVLTKQAMDLLLAKKYTEAIEAYGKILHQVPDSSHALYNTACAYALMGDKAKAIEFLQQAVANGFVDFTHIQKDPDLTSLHDEPGYQQLLADKQQYLDTFINKALGAIGKALEARGVQVGQYKKYYDKDRNFIYLHNKSDEEFTVIRDGLNSYAEFQWKTLIPNRPQRPAFIILLHTADSKKVFKGSIGGVYKPQANVLICGDLSSYQLLKTSVIRHEFTHLLHFSDMYVRNQQHPIWLIEGLATLFETAEIDEDRYLPQDSHRLALVQLAVRSGRAMPWAQIMGLSHADFMKNAGLAYAQSRYMLKFMHDQGVLKKFYDEYTHKDNYKSDKTALESVEVVFGKPAPVVERQWQQWIMQQQVPYLPYLGIAAQTKDGQLVIHAVGKKSPADKAGLEKGDVIKEVESRPVNDWNDVVRLLATKGIGDPMVFRIRRKDDADDKFIAVTIGKRQLTARRTSSPSSSYLGIAVEPNPAGGMRIRSIAPKSPADKAGLNVGDTLLTLGDEKLDSVREYLQEFKKTKPGQKIQLEVLATDGKKRTVKIKLDKQPK